MNGLTLGSLFDGSGSFPLAAIRNGITPVWASELEPFAIRVTTKRLPKMKHYGDITKLNGSDLEPVDIVSLGSPCTDVSTAGLRDGITGKQSSLFFEAIRVIREMREATNAKYPRFVVFENVMGLYSSGCGSDFRVVLEELVRLKDEAAVVPMPETGKWLHAGLIVGEGYSLAWRSFNAALWGVPQLRRRLYAVADFAGERADQILFESSGVSGDPAALIVAGEGTAAAAEDGAGGEGSAAIGFSPGAARRLGGHAWAERCGTLLADTGDNQAAVAYAISGNMVGRKDENGPNGCGVRQDVSFTLTARDRHSVAYALTPGSFSNVHREVAATLLARDAKTAQVVIRSEPDIPEYIVRFLTPQECAALQGCPTDWCANLETPEPTEDDIAFWTHVFEQHRLATKPHVKPRSRNQIVKWLRNPYTDKAEYRLWGSGIALPNASFVMAGIARMKSQTSLDFCANQSE